MCSCSSFNDAPLVRRPALSSCLVCLRLCTCGLPRIVCASRKVKYRWGVSSPCLRKSRAQSRLLSPRTFNQTLLNYTVLHASMLWRWYVFIWVVSMNASYSEPFQHLKMRCRGDLQSASPSRPALPCLLVFRLARFARAQASHLRGPGVFNLLLISQAQTSPFCLNLIKAVFLLGLWPLPVWCLTEAMHSATATQPGVMQAHGAARSEGP